jgi:5'-nucleotidase
VTKEEPRRPYVLITNDDGINSLGLQRLAQAVASWADVIVVAPFDQESRMSRATPAGRSGRIFSIPAEHVLGLESTFAIDGTPALAIQHALIELCSRRPALILAGINYGENVGSTATVSGTIGAVIEGASWDISSIAFSQQMPGEHMLTNPEYDFSLVAELSSDFCRRVIDARLPAGRAYKVDYPRLVTAHTEWKTTFVSRVRKYDLWPSGRARLWDSGPIQLDHEAWQKKVDLFEAGSDAHAIFVEGVISVSPLAVDATDRTLLDETANFLATRG